MSKTHLNVYLGEPLKAAWELHCQAKGLKPGAALRALIQMDVARSGEEATPPAAQQVEHPDRGRKRRAEIRFTPSELEAVDVRAEAEGCSRQVWLVNVVRGMLTKQPQAGMREIEALGESNYQLLAIGRNLNQIAKRLNDGHPDRITASSLGHLRNEIRAHTVKVSRVMGASIERWSLR